MANRVPARRGRDIPSLIRNLVPMTKYPLDLSEDSADFARRKVADGSFASVEAVIEAGIALLQQEEAQVYAVGEIDRDVIADRMATTRDTFVPWDGEAMLAQIAARRAEPSSDDDAA